MSPDVYFLFIDEKYGDANVPIGHQAVSITCMLVPAKRHKEFRAKYYDLVRDAIASPDERVINWMEQKHFHGASLLREFTDEVRYAFLEGLVELVNELNFRIIRQGYNTTRKLYSNFGNEKGVFGLCFASILHILRTVIEDKQVWPVIEIDRSPSQDKHTAGMMQQADYVASYPFITQELMWLKDSNFGEVFYMTKSSGYGSVVDCVGYLLHAKWRQSKGHTN